MSPDDFQEAATISVNVYPSPERDYSASTHSMRAACHTEPGSCPLAHVILNEKRDASPSHPLHLFLSSKPEEVLPTLLLVVQAVEKRSIILLPSSNTVSSTPAPSTALSAASDCSTSSRASTVPHCLPLYLSLSVSLNKRQLPFLFLTSSSFHLVLLFAPST